jgi:signal transduction histidine kinase/putative methionine-R-sulfoxide reductase with GAF domain
MSQLFDATVEIPPACVPLLTQLVQARDLATLEAQTRALVHCLLPQRDVTLFWSSAVPTELSTAPSAPISAGDATRPGWLVLRNEKGYDGWIKITPGQWNSELEASLGLLIALVGATYRSLPRHVDHQRDLIDRSLVRLRTELNLTHLLDGVDALVRTIIGPCSIVISLQYRTSRWIEAALAATDTWRLARPIYWRQEEALTAEILQRKQPLAFDNLAAECARRGIVPRMPETVSDGAWMGLPITPDQTTIGVLGVGLPAEPRFTADQQTLLAYIAQEIARPLENALRYRDAAESARQRATLNQIARAINSTLDPEQVPTQIVAEAARLLNTEECSLLLLDETTRDLVFSYASGPAGQSLLGTRLTYGEGIAGAVAASGRPAIVNNTAHDNRFSRKTDDDSGFRTRALIAAPLRGIDGVKGVIEVVNRHGDVPFTVEDQELLEMLADQAMIAIDNARRFAQVDQILARRAQDLDRSNHQLRTILSLGHALRAERGLDDLLRQIVRSVGPSAGFRSAVIALVYRDRTLEPYLQRVAAAGPAESALLRMRLSRAPLAQLQALLRDEFRRGSATYLIDRRFDDYIRLWGGVEHLYVPSAANIRPGGWHPFDAMFTLLRDNRGELLGILCVDDPEDGLLPTPEQIQILEILANQAATAIENAQLYAEQQHSLTSMTALNALGMAINTTLRSPDAIYQLTMSGMLALSDARWAAVFLRDTLDQEPLRPSFSTGRIPADLSRVAPLLHETLQSRRSTNLRQHEALLAVPLRGTGGVLGVIGLGYSEGLPRPADLESLTLFANQAAVAVESLELFAAVRQGRDQLATIMASTADGMLLLDQHQRIVVANSALLDLIGAAQWSESIHHPDELSSLTLEILLDRWHAAGHMLPSEISAVQQAVLAVASGAEMQVRGQIQSYGPGVHDLEWTIQPASHTSPATLPSAQPDRRAILLTVRDISADKEAERLRQDLTSMIVHDLRSPLTSILTSIDMIFRGITGEVSSVQREILTIAHASAQHLLNMVNMLLDISRLESRRMPLERSPIAIDTLIHRALGRMTLLAQKADVQFQVDLPASKPLVYADGELVLRVLQNLLDNALKFSPPGSQIRVEVTPCAHTQGPGEVIAQAGTTSFTTHNEHAVMFAICDSGVGISPQDQEKIFQKFGQAGDRRSSGSGLGLTFCRLVVEAHGGTIWVESEPGAGSTFRFTLPMAELHEQHTDDEARQ